MKKDFYQILDVSKNATAEEIKKAYRKKAIEYHPDRNPGNKEAEENFKLAAQAYEILSDPQKKANYDRFGHDAYTNQSGGFGGGGMNMDDIFSQFGDIFGSTFGGAFSGFRSGGTARARGANLRIKVKLTLEEIANGVEKKIKVKRKIKAKETTYKTCTTCGGSGQINRIANTVFGRMQTTTTCNVCNGIGEILDRKPANADREGMIIEEDTVSIKIPAGVADEMQLKVSRKGNEAPGTNSIPGDLIVSIEEIEHEFLKREGENIHYDLYISFPEAALGTTKEIQTINGKVRIKIDEGTQSGKILRLRSKGIPSLNGYETGDMLVHVNVWTPKKLNKTQRKFFEENKEEENFLPHIDKSEKSFFERVREMFS